MSDPWEAYFYPGTTVLRNKLDIHHQGELQVAERRNSGAVLLLLEQRPVVGNFDRDHLQGIHKALFHTVYDWAGKFRTVDMGNDTTDFAHYGHLDRYCEMVARSIREADGLRGCADAGEFAHHAARCHAALNYAHPFREGNGRTQREFIRTLGLNAGFEIDYRRLDRDRYVDGCIQALPGDDSLGPTDALARELRRCAVNTEPRVELQQRYDLLRQPQATTTQWRGTFEQAVREAGRTAAEPVAFVSASWREQSSIRVFGPDRLLELAAKAESASPDTGAGAVYTLHDGAIHNTATGCAEWLIVTADRDRHPVEMRVALDQHFKQAQPPASSVPDRSITYEPP